MAGAAKELSDAILINPNDINQMVEAIHTALTMPPEDQKAHISTMQESLKRYNIHHWVKIFMTKLNEVIDMQKSLATKIVDENVVNLVKTKYKEATKRILFLDYDGTLTGFHDDPAKAQPDAELISIIKSLARDKKNKVVIISGRDKQTLSDWLGDLNIDIIAEHGIWLKKQGKEWHTIFHMRNEWKDEFRPILESYVDRTPGSFVEEKDFSLVWHYRKVETGLGELRTRELASHLRYMAVNKNLTVMEGDKVVEIKNSEVNKGYAAEKWLLKDNYEFVFAVGDDWTDEDTFTAMPEGAITIKVGEISSVAKYRIESYKLVREFLKNLK
jgi:trehalose 6-phosphate synthase/phosphatase